MTNDRSVGKFVATAVAVVVLSVAEIFVVQFVGQFQLGPESH